MAAAAAEATHLLLLFSQWINAANQMLAAHLRTSDLILAALGLLSSSYLVNYLRLNTSITGRRRKGGPTLWPCLGIIPSLISNRHRIYDWATAELRRAGGTFPFTGVAFGGAHGAITADPVNLEYMLRTNFSNFPKGPYYRERFGDLLGGGIFNADGDSWRFQRRTAASEMHSPRFSSFSASTISDIVHNKLLPLLSNYSNSGDSVDLQDVFLRLTFDNICAAAFGVDPGCLAAGLPEVPFARAFEDATQLTLLRFLVPPFVWKPLRIVDRGPERQLRLAVRKVHEFAEETVNGRRAEFKKLGHLRERSDLLSRLVESQEEDNNNDEFFIRDYCISFILAGRDTSSVALAWFFWLLHGHPHVEERILDELHAVVGLRRLKNEDEMSEEVMFTVGELKKMEYLQAVLSESLRLYPSVPMDFKEAAIDDVLPDGMAVRRGGRVIYSIYSMARLKSVWGEDCCEFRPERWLREDGRFAAATSVGGVGGGEYKYPVFNAGPRVCVGKNFAYMQMKMVAASILLRYKVEVQEGQQVAPKLTTTLYMRNGLQVKFKPRDYKKKNIDYNVIVNNVAA